MNVELSSLLDRFRPSDIPLWMLQKIHFANVPRFELASSKYDLGGFRFNNTLYGDSSNLGIY